MSDDSSGVHGMRGKSQIPERYVYLASGEPGVVVLDYKVAVSGDGNNFSSMHLSDWTNQVRLIPTNTNLYITLPAAIDPPGMITVVSPSGRTIRSLQIASECNGKNMVVWDLCDNNGKTLPAGLYLIHIFIQGKSITKSFVKL